MFMGIASHNTQTWAAPQNGGQNARNPQPTTAATAAPMPAQQRLKSRFQTLGQPEIMAMIGSRLICGHYNMMSGCARMFEGGRDACTFKGRKGRTLYLRHICAKCEAPHALYAHTD